MARLCCATLWLPARNTEREREENIKRGRRREREIVAHVSALAPELVPRDGRKEEEQEEVEEEQEASD